MKVTYTFSKSMMFCACGTGNCKTNGFLGIGIGSDLTLLSIRHSIMALYGLLKHNYHSVCFNLYPSNKPIFDACIQLNTLVSTCILFSMRYVLM